MRHKTTGTQRVCPKMMLITRLLVFCLQKPVKTTVPGKFSNSQ